MEKPLSLLDRYELVEAGCRLKRKLGRENPGVFVYTGCHTTLPQRLCVHSAVEIDIPEQWAGFPVEAYLTTVE